MYMIRIAFCLICLNILLLSCKKRGCTDINAENYNADATHNDGSCLYDSDDSIKINIIPTFNDLELALDSVYNTTEGYKVKFTTLSFYVSRLAHQNDTINSSSLYDFRDNGNHLLAAELDYNSFPSLQCLIGVDSINNHSDPSAFDNDNDLNIENAGTMHWGWSTGYIFIKIEGKVDTLSNGIFDHNFSFHAGTDAFLRQLSFDNIEWVQTGENTHTFTLSLSMSDFLSSDANTIDLKDEFITHSSSGQLALTEKVVENFVNALSPQ